MGVAVVIALAGIRVSVEVPEAQQAEVVRALDLFHVPPEGPVAASVRAAPSPAASVKRPGDITDAGPQIESRLDGAALRLRLPVQFEGTYDFDARRGEFGLAHNPAIDAERPESTPSIFALSLLSLLRIVYSFLLIERGGAMLHASAVEVDGVANVFTALSGGGKTTMARLAPEGSRILGDDLVLLLPADGGFTVSGSPFLGEWSGVPTPGPYPLRGIFHLRKGAEDRLEELPLGQAARLLLRNLANFDPRPAAASRLLDLATTLSERFGRRALHFRPTPAVWSTLRDVTP